MAISNSVKAGCILINHQNNFNIVQSEQSTDTSNKNNFPLISVVLATFNGSRFLKEQLDSILAQTYQPIELIIVDDCSTDETASILNEYKNSNPLVKIFYNEVNLGFVKNFERGCSLATGQLVALSDQDDYWEPQKLEKLYNAMDNHSLIYCDSVLCDDQLNPVGIRLSDKVNSLDFNNCLQQAIFGRIPGHAMLVTKELVNKCLPFKAGANHDWWLGFAATIYGGIKFLPEPLVLYRQHSSNLFGAIGNKSKKSNSLVKQEQKEKQLQLARARINAFYEFCPAENHVEKKVLQKLAASYKDFSLANNLKRMLVFFSNHRLLLASKKRNKLRQLLICFKMFFKIE